MTVPVVLVIVGAVALLFGILGGGVKVKEFEIPSMAPVARSLAALAGLIFLALGIWLFFLTSQLADKANNRATPTAVAQAPSETQPPPTLTITLTPAPSGTFTPTSTSTPIPPTATPPPQPLVEIFPQVNGGEAFTYINNGGSLNSKYLNTSGCVHSGIYGMQLNYKMQGTGNGGWGVQWVNAPARYFNASGYRSLRFWIKGSAGGETFQVGLKDASGFEVKLESDKLLIVNLDWLPVSIPLNSFDGANLSRIENINFGFNRNHGAGTLCIDEIAFEQ